jgi:hypothetical protein
VRIEKTGEKARTLHPEVRKYVASKAYLRRRLDDRLSVAEENDRQRLTVPHSELPTCHDANAIFTSAKKDATNEEKKPLLLHVPS